MAAPALAAAALAGVAIYSFLPGDTTSRYVHYAGSVKEEGLERLTQGALRGYATTVRQAGIFGYGLGSATQGSYHIVRHGERTWQEDGISRLAAEIGVPGTVLTALALIWLIRAALGAQRLLPRGHPLRWLQASLIGVLAGNGASFVISHQAYSGDPSSIAIVSLCFGFVLAIPCVDLKHRTANRATAQQRPTQAARLATQRA
jgi:hypothetical protein